MLTVNVIIKRYFSTENGLMVMIHNVLWIFLIIFEIFPELKPFSGSATACGRTEHGEWYFLLFYMPENWTDGMNSIAASQLSRNGIIDWRVGLLVLWSKTIKTTAAIKKRTYDARELKVHTTGLGDSPAQLTLGQLLSGRVRMHAKAGYAANALGDLSAGTQLFGMPKQAHLWCFKHLPYWAHVLWATTPC